MALLRGVFDWITAAGAAFGNVSEFLADKLLAKDVYAVNIENSFKVVELVLNYTREEAGHLFFVGIEIFVEPFEEDVFHASDGFGKSWHTEATFVAGDEIAFENGQFRIDKNEFTVLTFGIVFSGGVGVYDDQADVFADLGRGKTNAVGFVHDVEHIVD